MKQPVLDVALTPFSVIFVIRPLQLLKMNMVSQQIETIATFGEDRIYDLRLVAYEGNKYKNVDKQKESYVLGVNRKKLIYIWRSSG